jgi:hypothetical protein
MNEKDIEIYKKVRYEINEIEEKVNLNNNTKLTLVLVIFIAIMVIFLFLFIGSRVSYLDSHLLIVRDIALNCTN